ncbi:unnamed protein product [Arabidopsis lyrata]|nr:unnamed protein product [Arabidopsis lyrata]
MVTIPYLAAASTYFSYGLLFTFGQLRDMITFVESLIGGKRRISQLSTALENFCLPLVTLFLLTLILDTLPSAWLMKISTEDAFIIGSDSGIWRLCFTGAPNTWVDLVERYSEDNNKTLKGCNYVQTNDKDQQVPLGSYNYLGFGFLDEYCTPRVTESLKKFSASTCSSRVDAGTTSVHEELEECVAKFVGQPAAVVFGMGYLTNSAIIPVLIGKGQPRTHRLWKKIIVVVEGIYSMEGEICHLPEIVSICKKYKAYVYLDEAHSIGAIGKTGRGVCELLGVDTCDVDIMMGTFTKSFGSCGGYIAGSKDLIQYLKYHCPAHLYATSISTPAAQQVISVIKVILGEDASNRAFSRAWLQENLAVVVVSFPAIPLLLARARFCISVSHLREDLIKALKVISRVGDLTGIIYFTAAPKKQEDEKNGNTSKFKLRI